MVFEKKYENGIRLIVSQMEGLFSVTAGILVGTGARYESDAEDGISHFIEHMQFKGTATKNAFELSDSFDRIGAQVNAFTGKEMTCYHVKCTSDHTEEAFSALADMFLNANYPEDEIAREKGVVCEEIAMNEDTPDDLCLDILAEALYGTENFGRTILGSAKNVKSFTKEDILAYKAKHYTPENTVIAFAGGITFELADKLCQKFFASLKKEKTANGVVDASYRKQSLFKKKEIEQVHIAIGFPAFGRDDKRLNAVRILSEILGGSMSSRLFQEVREKRGLAYSVYSYVTTYRECGSFVIYAGVNPDNKEKACKAIREVLENLKKNGITDDEFLRGREQMKSGMLFAQESTSSQMRLFGKEMLLSNRVLDCDKEINDIKAVTKEEVIAVIQDVLDLDKYSVGAVGKLDSPLFL